MVVTNSIINWIIGLDKTISNTNTVGFNNDSIVGTLIYPPEIWFYFPLLKNMHKQLFLKSMVNTTIYIFSFINSGKVRMC